MSSEHLDIKWRFGGPKKQLEVPTRPKSQICRTHHYRKG
uniref:Uncharacterized protein n=1 Tax=Arundo donax TaxID=35708 RepID=A0A0A9BFG2_ARUDO